MEARHQIFADKKTIVKSIGRYEIRATLGRGAMATVYKAVVPTIKKVIALKTLNPGAGLVKKVGMDWLRESFIREAVVMANIRHPNVADVWGLEEEPPHLFYLMEYFCHNLGSFIGESYWAETPTRILPVEKATRFLSAVLEGLARLHHDGIIHRDIKPFNIMLTDSGVVKIVDFGLSKRRGETPAATDEVMIGTRFYSAPEQIDHPEAADPRADLYSVGVMAYRMLTGRLPQKTPVWPSDLNNGLSASWDRFVLKAIDPDPGKRFPDARGMSAALERTYAEHHRTRTAECQLNDDAAGFSGAEKPASAAIILRSTGQRVTARQAQSVFDLDGLSRPRVYLANDIEVIDPEVAVDRATGLIWQRSGTEYPLAWDEARGYIDRLNHNAFGGFRHWRFPTVNELLSLLNAPSPGEAFCLESPFSSVQRWIWSSDSRSKRASWIVNVEMGFVMSSDVMDPYYAKAVGTL